jgi:Na+-translocating ferredoxin:NAD+ oxidoreductase subunit B
MAFGAPSPTRICPAASNAHTVMASLPASLALAIDACLPQTQCTRCGYPACLPYAKAIAADGAPINRCPPGGNKVIQALATLLDRTVVPLDPTCGPTLPLRVARIDEAQCIGCTLCIQACPVDAIIGAPKKMHVVIDELCTGCDLCVPPCPVDCIVMEPAPYSTWTTGQADQARERRARNEARKEAAKRRMSAKSADERPVEGAPAAPLSVDARRALIARAVERARAKRSQRTQ